MGFVRVPEADLEFALLRCLMEREGKSVWRADLVADAWATATKATATWSMWRFGPSAASRAIARRSSRPFAGPGTATADSDPIVPSDLLWNEREQSKTIHVFAPGIPLKELGVSLEAGHRNAPVVMVSLRVPRI
jgi:hypothetical protein